MAKELLNAFSGMPPDVLYLIIIIPFIAKRFLSFKTGLILSSYRMSSEKAMAPHSSILAWKIPWMEEPGGLQSMGSLGVGHD